MVSMVEMEGRRMASAKAVRETQRVAERYYGPPTNIATTLRPPADGSDPQPQLHPKGPPLNAHGDNVGPIMPGPEVA